ncbi:MAG TPA: DUF4129 domain-containing protein [Lacipirellula sp.]
MARLRMTNADYVAIAVSPALIMALVGSLVFFLIEVLYVGSYEIRLNYVFALFVFATVLIARIAIEFGSERAAMFSLPLGILVYLALMRFVQHSGPFSWLINLVLLAVVWWCAHKLTWDCTLIDDSEDASGEGLLGRVGLDQSDGDDLAAPGSAGGPASITKKSAPLVHDPRAEPGAARTDNELFAEGEGSERAWWQRLISAGRGPHTPGLWVLYFSLAALPLFGIGQHWIPPSDVGRRRYAFGLLAIYVAAALSLLVTTSFLGLRRYLRQRRVEMPAPMAATWVSLGAVLILLVMVVAALLPRPHAEYAISQAPWQAAAPGDLQASRYSVGEEGTDDPKSANRVTSDEQEGLLSEDTGGEQDSAADGEEAGDAAQKNSPRTGNDAATQESNQSSSTATDQSGDATSRQSSEEGGAGSESGEGQNQATGPDSNSEETEPTGAADEQAEREPASGASETNGEDGAEQGGSEESSAMSGMFEHSESSPPSPLETLQTATSSIANLLKLMFYAIIAAVIAYFAWTRREVLWRAMADIVRQLRELWARLFGSRATAAAGDEATESVPIRRRAFREFTDPFASGAHRRMPPVELVRYTFDAFEAWAGDRGRVRSPDQTPMELVRGALPPQSPMYTQARQLVQLYNEAAYSAGAVSREAAERLQALWQMMRASATTQEQAG